MGRTLEAIDEALTCLAQLTDQRFQDATKALDLARSSMEQRLEGMNEFRAQLDRQAGNFIGRMELEDKLRFIGTKLETIDKRVQGVESIRENINGRLLAFGVVGGVIVVVLEFLMHYVLKAH